MNNFFRYKVKYSSFLLIVLISFLCTVPSIADSNNKRSEVYLPFQTDKLAEKVRNLTDILETVLKKDIEDNKSQNSRIIADSLYRLLINGNLKEQGFLSKSYYLIGASFAIGSDFVKAVTFFEKALELLKKYPDEDLEGRVNYLYAYSAGLMGDYFKSAEYGLKSLYFKKKQYGEKSYKLVDEYTSLSNSFTGIRDFEKAIEYADLGLKIAGSKPDSVEKKNWSILYQSKGLALLNMSEYKQANLNFHKALELYEEATIKEKRRFINILDNLGTSYYYLGNLDLCSFYYNKAIISDSEINGMYINLCTNYAIILGNEKRMAEGEKIMLSVLGRSKRSTSGEIRDYYEMLFNYAEYLREYKISLSKSSDLFLECYKYSRSHPDDLIMSNKIAIGFSKVLMDSDLHLAALDSIQSVLVRNCRDFHPADNFTNPKLVNFSPDQTIWEILRIKYQVLRKLYDSSKKNEYNLSAAETAELRVSVLEQMRINIGEEESRLLLGNTGRDSYLDGINSFYLCYNSSGQPEYLEKVFELSERSKAASLLASTREMKAMKFHVPPELASLENQLQREVGFYEAKLTENSGSSVQAHTENSLWVGKVLLAVQKRDSLNKFFEKNFPDYFALKNNTQVLKTSDISRKLGKGKNYISYVLSDSSLYILLINNKYKKLIAEKTGKDFSDTINYFRKLISEPDLTGNASKQFIDFQETGYLLYKSLIEPVRKYLVSDNLVISPDNILAYFPFDILISDSIIHKDNYYNKLNYLMKDYHISYTYSATFLGESEMAYRSLSNTSVSFAPHYERLVNVDSLFVKRQSGPEILPELKYAKEEAIFVSNLTHGKLYIDNSATISAYKAEAGKYDIIHLAMHTILKDHDPLNSGMIFSAEVDTSGNKTLGTYEITGVPLKAKMVVLSSCYTGTGKMFQGEGVLSLARGFIFSGSKSVVMSLWEVNDRSGTEIINSFYRNLKAGFSKSNSLRKARIKYLKSSDQLRSHPFFWSTLVVYGDDSPLYYTLLLKIVVISFILILVTLGILYFNKR